MTAYDDLVAKGAAAILASFQGNSAADWSDEARAALDGAGVPALLSENEQYRRMYREAEDERDALQVELGAAGVPELIERERAARAVVEAARKWDEELELVAYTALQEHGAAVQCPGCDGNGDDIRHGTCTLCAGTGELNYHRLLDVATELDRLRLQVEGLGRAKTSDA